MESADLVNAPRAAQKLKKVRQPFDRESLTFLRCQIARKLLVWRWIRFDRVDGKFNSALGGGRKCNAGGFQLADRRPK